MLRAVTGMGIRCRRLTERWALGAIVRAAVPACAVGCEAFADEHPPSTARLVPANPTQTATSLGTVVATTPTAQAPALSSQLATSAPLPTVDTDALGFTVITEPPAPDAPCAVPDVAAEVAALTGTEGVLYAWLNDEQAAALKTGADLFSEEAGLAATATTDGVLETLTRSRAFADVIVGDATPPALAVSPRAWARRLPRDASVPTSHLVQVRLNTNAWVADFIEDNFSARDLEGRAVPPRAAVEEPTRIGLLRVQQGAFNTCFGSQDDPIDYWLFNAEAVQSWSVDSDEVRAALQVEVNALSDLLRAVRTCPPQRLPTGCTTWNADSPLFEYAQLLDNFSPDYIPDPQHLGRLISALTDDLSNSSEGQ